ncbi:hypothetical protein C0995_013644 [Termitomyces sp. Mi166|nr:hypothetical protein C0995_013644 [Termitomyces sp. Mi166\
MIPPKVVPLPIIPPNSSLTRTPPKVTSKPVPKPSLKTSPPRHKAAPKSSLKISPPKPTMPKVKPAFKVSSQVTDSRSKQPQVVVRRRTSVATRTLVSSPLVSSLDFTNSREGVYPRAIVQEKTYSYLALVFVDMKERPEDHPRPPHVTQPKSAPMKRPIDDTLSLPSAPLGPQAIQETVTPVPIHYVRPSIKDTSPSAQVFHPLVTVESRSAGQLIASPPTGYSDWRRFFSRFSMALRRLFTWVRWTPDITHG